MFHVWFFYRQKNKPPSYFKTLRCRFHDLFGFLIDNQEIKLKTIRKLETLMLHTLSTEHLIEKYYLQRLQPQKDTKESNEGFLAVTLVFINDVLRIEILNDHCIDSMDSRG